MAIEFKKSVTVEGDVDISGALIDTSSSPGTVNQLLSSTVTGTAWIDQSTIVAEAATVVVIACKNTSGATITKGTPVYQTGTVGATATIEIALADALISTGDLPAIGLLQTDLINNAFGFVVITGELTNFTTSPIDGVVPTTGDKVFLKSGGGLTLTKPTGEGNGIQNLGLIGKVSGGNSGSITVSSIMRTNDVPNLPEGRIWVGDGNTLVSDTVYIDEPNLRLGIGTTTPGAPLEVSGRVYQTGLGASTLFGYQAGLNDDLTTNRNSFFGYQAGLTTTTGIQNAAIGYQALYSNTTGNYNTAHGMQVLYQNTTGTGNVGAGYRPGFRNITGHYNVAIGYRPLYNNQGGNYSVAIGREALHNTATSYNVAVGSFSQYGNITGTQNVSLGYNALRFNSTGNYNTAIGTTALYRNTALGNTSVGYQSLYENTSATGNTAMGYKSLRLNTQGTNLTATGYESSYSNTTGRDNTSTGYQALYNNTTGRDNTAMGWSALYTNTNTSGNTSIGAGSLYNNTEGVEHTAVGYQALYNNTEGTRNTGLGYSAGSSTISGDYNTSVGYNAQPSTNTASNEFTLGDANISTLRCNVTSITSISDQRDKTRIIDSPYGLNFINTLRPRQFEWASRNGDVKDGTTRIGFMAQELLEACGENNGVLDLVSESNPDRLEATYGNLLPIAIQAIKDLSARIVALEERR